MPSRFIRRFLLAALAIVVSVFFGCGEDSPSASTGSSSTSSAPTKVTLSLNWFPEAEHGGFYAAVVHGYYREAGLDVTIVPGGPGVPVMQEVATGKSTFGVSTADQTLLAQAAGADVVAVMSPLQTSPRCVMVHEASGIKRFEDLKNLTLAVGTGSTMAELLKHNLPLENVNLVPYTGNVAEFLTNPNFAQQAYVFSEPFVAKNSGGDPHCLMVSELGFNPYTCTLTTSRTVIDTDPNLVRRMVAASIRGWQKYLESPDETNRHIHEQNPEMSLDILAFGAKELLPLCVTADVPVERLGEMTGERWQATAEQLIAAGVIKPGSVDAEQAYTTRFLPERTSAK